VPCVGSFSDRECSAGQPLCLPGDKTKGANNARACKRSTSCTGAGRSSLAFFMEGESTCAAGPSVDGNPYEKNTEQHQRGIAYRRSDTPTEFQTVTTTKPEPLVEKPMLPPDGGTDTKQTDNQILQRAREAIRRTKERLAEEQR
jgi:hypothetical protein